MAKTELNCESCEKDQTRDEYVAVGPSTPAARHLNLTEPTKRDHHVVCEDCFGTVTEEIQDGLSGPKAT